MTDELKTDEQLRELFGDDVFDTVLKSERHVVRDLSKKVCDDINNAIIRTASLPGISVLDRVLIMRNAAFTTMEILAGTLAILHGNMDVKAARALAIMILKSGVDTAEMKDGRDDNINEFLRTQRR